MVTTELSKIFLKDILGAQLNLGEFVQIYRPRSVRTLMGTVTKKTMQTPPAWFWAIFKLDSAKGFVFEVISIHHPEGVTEDEVEPVKLGWRVKNSAKYVIIKTERFTVNDLELNTIYPHATKSGMGRLKKAGLCK